MRRRTVTVMRPRLPRRSISVVALTDTHGAYNACKYSISLPLLPRLRGLGWQLPGVGTSRLLKKESPERQSPGACPERSRRGGGLGVSPRFPSTPFLAEGKGVGGWSKEKEGAL